MIRSKYVTMSLVIALSALAYGSPPENWTQWRGPTADGRASNQAKPPLKWDQQTNIAWTATLPGNGSATPIVIGNQILVLSAAKTDRKSATAFKNDERAKTVPDEYHYQFIITSIDRTSGKTLWQQVATEQVPHEGKHNTNTYAAGSPITDGERIYFSFGSRGVFCYTLQGELVWKIDLGDMRTRSGWGEAITPALTDNALIINWDQEEDSFIVALDKFSGKELWKVNRPEEVTSWNTPFVTTFEGKQQIIVNGTGSVKSYAAGDGSMLWECSGQTTNAIPSPIRFGDSAICMSGYRGSLACSIPLGSKGNVTENGKTDWKVTQGTPYVPSPIVSGSRLFFTAGNTAVLSCLDARTGETLSERKRLPSLQSLYASPILANGHLYFTSREGITVVVEDNEKLDVVAVNPLDDVIDASPVAVNDQLFLRSWTKLYCIENTSPSSNQASTPVNAELLNQPIAFKQFELEELAETSANTSLGDLDGDGDLDVVLAKGRHWPLQNRVLLNQGKGKFETSGSFDTKPDRTYSTALGDIDRDGDLDIVVSNDSPDEKKILLNDGHANFSLGGNWGDPDWNTRNTCLVDINGDRFLDLVVANRKSRSYIILNDGKGNFDSQHWVAIPSESATTIVAADFNGDGRADLAVPHRDHGVSHVLFNDDRLEFKNRVVFGPQLSSTRACASGDLNGDGAIDLVVGDDQSGMMVCINDGKGAFPQTKPVGNPSMIAYAIAVADLNQDQKADLVVGYAKGGCRAYLNEGSGTSFQELRVGDEQGSVYGIAIGDIDLDGKNDMVVARSEATNVMFLNLGNETSQK